MARRTLSVVLVALFLFGILAGCSGNGGSSETDTDSNEGKTSETTSAPEKTEDAGKQEEKPKETIEISMTVLDRGGIPAELGSYAENAGVDNINEEMAEYGIQVSVVPVPRNQSYDKMNAMLAAGTAPDILWEYSRGWCNQLRVQKVILPVDDIIEKYSTDYKAYFEANKDLLAPYVTMDDGKMYAFTSLRAASALPTAGVWYRKDLVEEAGLKAPETLEDVIDVSKAVREKHPDIVPIAASLHYLNIIGHIRLLLAGNQRRRHADPSCFLSELQGCHGYGKEALSGEDRRPGIYHGYHLCQAAAVVELRKCHLLF